VKVLVTGGTSLLGGKVALQLADAGHEVAVLQRRPSELGLTETLGDIGDRDVVDAAVVGKDVVVHLAARVGVTGTWEQFVAANVDGTRNVLDAARAAGVERFLYISSPSVAHAGSSLVGASASLPADPDRTRGHYATSKAMAEVLALAANAPGFAVTAIRPHLVWGPGDTQLVGRIVARARKGRLAFVGSGAALIDTTYLDNAVDAIVAAVDRLARIAGRAFVISNGQPRPVRELVSGIVRAAGLEPPRRSVPYPIARSGGLVAERIWEAQGRDDDPPMTSFLAEQLATAHWFDQREVRRLLDWEPQVGIDEGFVRLRRSFEPLAASS
jgi:nucleoside-diphosphate-sugar epimerase